MKNNFKDPPSEKKSQPNVQVKDEDPELQQQLEEMGLGQLNLAKSNSSKIIQIINNYNVNINNNYNPDGSSAPIPNFVIEEIKNMNETQMKEHLQ
jgi:hypothetical protein